MSFGQQFLARLDEAKKQKGFTFDRAVEAMKRGMRDIGGANDLADKIGETMAFFGIQGVYLNKQDVKQSVVDAANSLRTKAARVRSFLALHSALSAFYGVGAVKEAKAEKPDFSDAELEGSQFQQMVEEILVLLGAPRELFTGDAKAAVKAGLRRTCAKLRQDENVRMAVLTLARYSGIKLRDGVAGSTKDKPPAKKGQELAEAVDYMATAQELLKAIGLNLGDETVVRVVNPSKMNRLMAVATRKPQVRAGLIAFSNKMKSIE